MWLRSVCALVVAIAVGIIGWRVLAPAEVLAAHSPPDVSDSSVLPGVTGRVGGAPLVVGGRLRVWVAKRQVRADAPVSASSMLTPSWSYRRWPAQLSGVVAVGSTAIGRWSDGELVAIDGATGKIAWRASGPPAPGFEGHHTGAATVWAPPGMHVAGGSVMVIQGQKLAAYAGSTGKRLWSTTVPAGCADGFTTAGGLYVCSAGAYDTATGSAVASFPAGPFTPLGCGVAASSCAGLRDGDGRGWMVDRAVPRRVPVLDRAGSTVVAGLVIYPAGGTLRAVSPDGAALWSYPAAAQVLGASGSAVVLFTPGRHLVVIDARSGLVRTDFALLYGAEKDLSWELGRWQVGDGFVAVERLAQDHPADPDTPGYYHTEQPVIVAAV